LKICGDVAAGVRRLPNQGSGLMQKRKFARERAGEVSLPELLDRLERALTGIPPRTSVFRNLSDLNYRLGSASQKAAAPNSRSMPLRLRRRTAMESLPLFS
jgi:hypothetical protein